MFDCDRDFGDETDFNEWVEDQFEDDEDFYIDPEYYDDYFDSNAFRDDDDGDESGALALV